MTESLTHKQYANAVRHGYSKIRFPWGFPPGHEGAWFHDWNEDSQIPDLSTKGLWDAMQWNPMGNADTLTYRHLKDTDADASPKPSWDWIVDQWEEFEQVERDRLNPPLPSDPDEVRDELIKQLAAHTNTAVKQIVASTMASSTEQQQAVETIAAIQQRGVISLNRGLTTSDIKSLHSTIMANIDAVQTLNAPLWVDLSGKPLTLDSDKFYVISHIYDASKSDQPVVTLRATNPVSTEDLGDVAVVEMKQTTEGEPWDDKVWKYVRRFLGTDASGQVADVFYKGAPHVPPVSSELTLVARNNSGPKSLKIRINAT